VSARDLGAGPIRTSGTAAGQHRVGRSYADFLRGRSPTWRSRLYFEYAHVRGIRTRTLKYLERAEGYPNEMFDLEADRGETRNVIEVSEYRVQRDALHRFAVDPLGRVTVATCNVALVAGQGVGAS